MRYAIRSFWIWTIYVDHWFLDKGLAHDSDTLLNICRFITRARHWWHDHF